MGPAVVTLSGLVLDIIGAFVLAIEAIGLDRVQEWGRRLTAFIESQRTRLVNQGVAVLVLFVMITSGIFTSNLHQAGTTNRIAIGLLWVLLAILLTYAISFILGSIAHNLGAILLALQARARRQSVGLLGFGLLLVGFLLQFIGTLWGALAN